MPECGDYSALRWGKRKAPDFLSGAFCLEEETISKNKNKLYAMIGAALLGAVGFVLMTIEVSVPIMPDFIKLDFAELPVRIAAYAYGPVYGIAVCLP